MKFRYFTFKKRKRLFFYPDKRGNTINPNSNIRSNIRISRAEFLGSNIRFSEYEYSSVENTACHFPPPPRVARARPEKEDEGGGNLHFRDLFFRDGLPSTTRLLAAHFFYPWLYHVGTLDGRSLYGRNVIHHRSLLLLLLHALLFPYRFGMEADRGEEEEDATTLGAAASLIRSHEREDAR